jgi:hypothetical protein
MAKNGKNGFMSNDAYNQSSNKEETPDGVPYFSYDEMLANHNKQEDMIETVNSESGAGINGGPAPGEPNPTGLGGKNGR